MYDPAAPALHLGHHSTNPFVCDVQVMALQTARYLVSSLAKIKAGNKVQGSVEYLAQKLPSKWNVATAAHLGDTDRLIAALRFLSSSLVNVSRLDRCPLACQVDAHSRTIALPLLQAGCQRAAACHQGAWRLERQGCVERVQRGSL